VVDLLEPDAQVWKPVPAGITLFLEIGARGESASRAGDHQRPDRVVLGDLRHRVAEIAPELCVPGVEGIRPVEQDARGRTVGRQVDGFVAGHSSVLHSSVSGRSSQSMVRTA
jgi:hypothetical protein